jgi:hypothetical protein
MNNHNKYLIFAIITILFFTFAGAILSKAKCSAQWRDSTYEYHWGYISGCRISIMPNVWIPEKAIRVFE